MQNACRTWFVLPFLSVLRHQLYGSIETFCIMVVFLRRLFLPIVRSHNPTGRRAVRFARRCDEALVRESHVCGHLL